MSGTKYDYGSCKDDINNIQNSWHWDAMRLLKSFAICEKCLENTTLARIRRQKYVRDGEKFKKLSLVHFVTECSLINYKVDYKKHR